MTAPGGPTPDKVMQFITGGWVTAIVGSAARHGVFNVLEAGGDHAEGVAQKTGISLRGAQAVLDGLAGLGLVSQSNGSYQNSPEASAFLVKGKPAYIGGMAEVFMDAMTDWARLGIAVKCGKPARIEHVGHGRQRVLASSCSSNGRTVLPRRSDGGGTARRRRRPDRVNWLDVGGGSGVWSAVWLGANKQANGKSTTDIRRRLRWTLGPALGQLEPCRKLQPIEEASFLPGE